MHSKYAALGTRMGITLHNLDRPHKPFTVLSYSSAGEKNMGSNTLEFHPNEGCRNIIASACNQNISLWRVEDGVQSSFSNAHQRVVTDLSFSRFDNNLLASGSPDFFVKLWDLRDAACSLSFKLKGPCSNVKFARLDEHALATSHSSDINVWDKRNVARPLAVLFGHTGKITTYAGSEVPAGHPLL